MYIWVSSDAPPQLIKKILGVDHFDAIPEDMVATYYMFRVCIILLCTVPIQKNVHAAPFGCRTFLVCFNTSPCRSLPT